MLRARNPSLSGVWPAVTLSAASAHRARTPLRDPGSGSRAGLGEADKRQRIDRRIPFPSCLRALNFKDGVESICKVLPIAQSTYRAHTAKRADPAKLSTRAKRDAIRKIEISRVFAENFDVYGVRKVWRQLRRESEDIARCTVERLMRSMGLQGRDPRQACQVHDQRQGRAVSAGSCQPPVPGTQAERALGLRFHLCRDLDWLRLFVIDAYARRIVGWRAITDRAYEPWRSSPAKTSPTGFFFSSAAADRRSSIPVRQV